MPAADFAAAQQRLASRRAQRAAHNAHQSPSHAPRRIPFTSPLSTFWTTISSRSGTRPAFRVGQVDAELLDNELLELLKGQVGEALKFFGSHITDTWGAEILLALRVILFKLSVWDQNASYGAHLQGLKYTDARKSGNGVVSKWQKIGYGLVSVGGRYAWGKWEEWLAGQEEDYTRPADPRVKTLASITERLNSAHDVASLASFLVFLINGRYRTLTDRLLRLRLTPASNSMSREVSFEYLNRQLVWHAFTEFLLFLLPLVGISRWRRILSRSFRRISTQILHLLGRTPPPSDPSQPDTKNQGPLHFLPERTCAICFHDQNPSPTSEAHLLATSSGGVVGSAATDITNPYEALPCGCIYCFACLAQRIANEEGEGWSCLRCGEVVGECRSWGGDVVEEKREREHRPESRDAKSVGFVAEEREGGVLREVEPRPEDDDDEETRVEKTRGLDLGDELAFTESSEWAKAGEEDDSSGEEEDTQSEEYDEEEEEGSDMGGFASYTR